MNKVISVIRFITLIIGILLIGLYATSQVWSEPKNITNDSYHDSFPDICIDNNGVLHCVWVKQFETGYRAIYYSKSTNQGYSWYPPYKISPYNTGQTHRPSINSDSLNNLYVIYIYDINNPYQENYYFTKFNGQNWSSPVTICDEYPGAFVDEVVMDNQARLYIFWHGFEHYPFYKYYENEAWSEIINIYDTLDESPYVKAAVSDESNNLHCIGYISQLPVYLFYDFANNEWYQPHAVGIQKHIINFEDIDIDNQGNPCLVWREKKLAEPGVDATVFRKKTGDTWGELEQVIEGSDNLALQKIDVFDDDIFIIETEDMGEIDSLMIYRKDYMGSWYGALVDNYYRIEPWKVLHDNDYLYVLMLRQQSYGELLDVFITKASLDIITTLANEQSPSFNFNVFIGQNYPNPFIHTTTIAYELYNSGYVSMSIQDISGKTILYRVLDYQVPGKYTITWDGLDNQQKSIHPGIYFYSIIVNGHKLTRSIILAK